jgi:MoxR-like ATPase
MNIQEIQLLLSDADAVNQVPLIESVHGLGKSTICNDYADQQGLHFEPLFLSLLDTGDLIGIPVTATIGGQLTTTWAAPTWYTRIVDAAWPVSMKVSDLEFNDESFAKLVKAEHADAIDRGALNMLYCEHFNLRPNQMHILRQNVVSYKHAQRSMLFLDEMNRAPMDVLNASLQLILEKRLNDHVLPRVHGKDTLIVTAINPAGGDYTVTEFEPALLDRFVVSELQPDAKSWLQYARESNLNAVIREYITENPTKLHTDGKPGGRSIERKGASPRTWTRLAKYLDSTNNNITEGTMNYLVGTLGEGLAAEFFLFLEGYARSMTPEQWIKQISKKRSKDPIKLGKQMAKVVDDLEGIKRNELAANLAEHYKECTEAKDALPYLAYLHALPTENLAAYLTSLRQDVSKADTFKQLVEFDKELTNKELFRKIVSKTK